MMAQHDGRKTRREFLRASAAVPAAAAIAPWLVPSGILGANAPSSRIQIGIIGTGRIAREHDIPGVLKYDSARIVAVCDIDAKRCLQGKQFVEDASAKRGINASGVKTYADYRELLQDKGVDAVMVCTPDHWPLNWLADDITDCAPSLFRNKNPYCWITQHFLKEGNCKVFAFWHLKEIRTILSM